MAIITRSIPAVPYQGGTPQTAQPYSAAVQLTPTRMVWTYCQTNPAWRFFVIVDTPEGYVNGGNPVVTVARMQDQRSYQGIALNMVRLNDNSFALFDANSVSTGVWTAEAFDITSELEIKRTYYNNNLALFAAGPTNQTTAGLKFANLMTFVPVKDNAFYLVEQSYSSSSYIYGRVVTYDNTKDINSALTVPASGTNIGTLNNSYSTGELILRQIPGAAATKYSLCWHSNTLIGTATVQAWNNPTTTNAGLTTNSNLNNAAGGLIIDVAPTIANTATAPTINISTAVSALNNAWVYVSSNQQPITGMASVYDVCHMSETRMARLNWQNAYFYHPTNITTQNNVNGNNQQVMVSQGGGAFSYGTASTNPMMAYPLSNDFIMLIDRTHFLSSTSGDLKVKIIRRDDSNFVSVSGGSTAGNGFSVTAPWIDTWRQDSRPRMLANGDLFWWGLDATTGNANLTWNILKNAS